jgi:hypothetical protein
VYSCEDCKYLNGKLARYEENIHPEIDRGDVLVIEEGLCVDSESLNSVKPLTLERKVYKDMDKIFIWKVIGVPWCLGSPV